LNPSTAKALAALQPNDPPSGALFESSELSAATAAKLLVPVS
jgi:hypothetical protein